MFVSNRGSDVILLSRSAGSNISGLGHEMELHIDL
jgi:hypothetical protein